MKRAAIMFAVALAFAGGFALGTAPTGVAQAQTQYARCTASVPRAWGEFKGFSQRGFAFEDQSGTIRFVTQMPCGIGEPQVTLEINRE